MLPTPPVALPPPVAGGAPSPPPSAPPGLRLVVRGGAELVRLDEVPKVPIRQDAELDAQVVLEVVVRPNSSSIVSCCPRLLLASNTCLAANVPI